MTTIQHIIGAIESVAPNSLQESWDNTGLIVGSGDQECTGVMICVDVTPQVVEQAIAKGCNLIVSHHPLIFRGLKRINGGNRVEDSVMMAIRHGIAIYGAHTSIDKALDRGVSFRMAAMLGLRDVEVLSPDPSNPGAGLGVIGSLPAALSATELVEKVKQTFDTPVVRCTAPTDKKISRIALCGGSGSEFIPLAHHLGAEAFLTSDTRYHDFSDWEHRIFLMDIGHFESEQCTKQIFNEIIREKFPTFANCYLAQEKNPIRYL